MSRSASAKQRLRLLWQFVQGVLYLAFASALITTFIDGSFLLVFAAVITGAVFTGAMTVAWAGSWATRSELRTKQFTIRTLLFLTLIAAAYLGAVRWIAELAGGRVGNESQTFLASGVMCLVLTGISLPFLLIFMDSLVWFAVWLVRRPWVRAWLRRR